MRKKSPEVSESKATHEFLTEINSGMQLLIPIRKIELLPTPEEAARAFAAKMLLNEMDAHGLSLNKAAATEERSLDCLHRLHEWTLARLKAYALHSRKEIPDGEHSDKEFAHAAFLAATFYEDDHWAEVKKLSPNAKKKFEREFSKPTRAKWKHPHLDMWLVSIWPLVTAYDWTYRDVWMVAARHPQLEESFRFETVDSFVTHCKCLELRLNPKASQKTGRVKGEVESRLPFMSNIALKCRADVPENSLICQQKSRK